MKWLRHRAPYLVMVVAIALAFGGINDQVHKNETNSAKAKVAAAKAKVAALKAQATADKLTSFLNQNCARQIASRKFNDESIRVQTEPLPLQPGDPHSPVNLVMTSFNVHRIKELQKLKGLELRITAACLDRKRGT